MPKLLDRLVSQLKAKGMPEQKAYGVATRTLQKAGDLKRGSQDLTPKGKRREAMGAEGRAKSRAAQYSGRHKPGEYVYSKRTNRATLRGK